MADLFERDIKTIGKHINNALKEELMGDHSVVANFAITASDVKQVLSVVEKYSVALDLLDAYDHQSIIRPEGSNTIYVLSYEECRKVIDSMKFEDDSDVFGNEKDDSFKGSIGAIYQTFAQQEVYVSLEEKAANLLYFIVKNHSFSDGNKRIGAAIFLYLWIRIAHFSR